MNSILFFFREFHDWDESDIAKQLSISLQDYKDLEMGIERVDGGMATKLSKLFKAPAHIFFSNNFPNHFSIIYSHCHFENSNGYVNHLYNEQEPDVNAMVCFLKLEVQRLRKENEILMERLTRSTL